jgi:hypothetical protein
LNILRNSKNSQIFFQLIADIIAIWLGLAFQLYLRFFSGIVEIIALPTFFDYAMGSCLMTIFWLLVFAITGMYKN